MKQISPQTLLNMIPIRLVILGFETLSRMQGLNMNGREPDGIQKVDLLPTAIKVTMTVKKKPLC